jgi:hypothetical protein
MFDWLGWLRRLEFTALAAMAIAGLCIMVGQSAQRFAEQTAPHVIRLAGSSDAGATSRLSVIDYASTGSIGGGTIVLSPCKSSD